jgi:hypothetical protein
LYEEGCKNVSFQTCDGSYVTVTAEINNQILTLIQGNSEIKADFSVRCEIYNPECQSSLYPYIRCLPGNLGRALIVNNTSITYL